MKKEKPIIFEKRELKLLQDLLFNELQKDDVFDIASLNDLYWKLQKTIEL